MKKIRIVIIILISNFTFSQNVFDGKTLKKIEKEFNRDFYNGSKPSSNELTILNIENVNPKYKDNYMYSLFIERRKIEKIDFTNSTNCYKFPKKQIIITCNNLDENFEKLIKELKLIKYTNNYKNTFDGFVKTPYLIIRYNKNGIIYQKSTELEAK